MNVSVCGAGGSFRLGRHPSRWALLVDGPEFEPPERPVTYDVVALAFDIQGTTVREHMRRIRNRHPELYAELMTERNERLDRWHADVSKRRLERSRRWGKARRATRYKAERGEWPWAALARTGRLHPLRRGVVATKRFARAFWAETGERGDAAYSAAGRERSREHARIGGISHR